MRRAMLTGVWLVALGLATGVAWQIVSAADDQVSERPVAPLNVAAPILIDPATSTAPPSSVTTPGVGSTTSSSAVPTTEVGVTTTTEAGWLTRLVQTTGGNVLLRYRAGEVTYQSATPAPGYQVEVDHPGPPGVKVEFESQSDKVEIEAAWVDGALEIDVSGDDAG